MGEFTFWTWVWKGLTEYLPFWAVLRHQRFAIASDERPRQYLNQRSASFWPRLAEQPIDWILYWHLCVGCAQVLRYPGSFRACLVQVSNAGWEAFNAAHVNMDQIRLMTGNVDAHVKTAVKFLVEGQDREVQSMVPEALNNVQRIADDCVRYSSFYPESILLLTYLGRWVYRSFFFFFLFWHCGCKRAGHYGLIRNGRSQANRDFSV